MARNIPSRIVSEDDAANTTVRGEMAKLTHLYEESSAKSQTSRNSEDCIPTAESSWHNWDYGSDSCLFDG